MTRLLSNLSSMILRRLYRTLFRSIGSLELNFHLLSYRYGRHLQVLKTYRKLTRLSKATFLITFLLIVLRDHIFCFVPFFQDSY